MSKKRYKRNILMLTLHLIFSKRITGPIMMIFYQSMGLSYTQIGTLSSTTWLADASLEIAGGSFSDTYGRKQASLLYAILGMTSMAIYGLCHGYSIFFLASAIYGAALAVGSGNASALLFDTLKLLKLEESYKRFRGQIQFPAKIFNGLTVLLLPTIYSMNIRLPFALGFLFYLVSFITALFLIEPPRSLAKHSSMWTTACKSLKIIFQNSQLKLLIAIQIMASGFLLLGFEYFQAIFKNAGIPLMLFGVIYAGARLVEGLGSLWAHKLEKYSTRRIFTFLLLMLIAAMTGFAMCTNWLVLFFIVLLCLCDGAIDIVIGHLTNLEATPQTRTTIISTANFICSLFFSLLLLIMGMVSDWVGVNNMFLIASVLVTLTSIFLITRKNL